MTLRQVLFAALVLTLGIGCWWLANQTAPDPTPPDGAAPSHVPGAASGKGASPAQDDVERTLAATSVVTKADPPSPSAAEGGAIRVSFRTVAGAPVPGCVAAVFFAKGRVRAESNLTSDAHGVIVYDDLAPGPYEVFAASGEAQKVSVLGRTTHDIAFEISDSALSGRVETPAGVPVGDADVFVQLRGRKCVHGAVTDSSGQFRVLGANVIGTTLFARSAAFGPSPRYTLRVLGSSGVVIRLTDAQWEIRGVIRSPKVGGIAPVYEGLEVRLEPRLLPGSGNSDSDVLVHPELAKRAKVDASGTFSFAGLGCPSAHIIVLSDRFAHHLRLVKRPPLGGTARVVLDLHAAARIAGTVLTASQVPATSGFVVVESVDGEEPLMPVRAAVGKDGKFELSGLSSGLARVRADTSSGAASAELQITSGQTASWMPTVSTSLAIRVRVRASKQLPVEPLIVLCVRKGTTEMPRVVALDGEGAGVVGNLELDDYVLCVRSAKGGLPLDCVTARPGDAVHLTTTQAASVRFGVSRQDNGAVSVLKARVECEEWSQNCSPVRVGQFWQIGPLKPGTYKVRLRDGEGYVGEIASLWVVANERAADGATCMLSPPK